MDIILLFCFAVGGFVIGIGMNSAFFAFGFLILFLGVGVSVLAILEKLGDGAASTKKALEEIRDAMKKK